MPDALAQCLPVGLPVALRIAAHRCVAVPYVTKVDLAETGRGGQQAFTGNPNLSVARCNREARNDDELRSTP
jgi:hypothetical protein